MPDLRAIFYVSESSLGEEADREIADLVDAAQVRNAASGITGALVFTGKHFAQYIEGPLHEIAGLVRALRADRRHRNMTIYLDENPTNRRLEGWALAYTGPSLYVSKHLERIQNAPPHQTRRGVDRVLNLLQGLVEDAGQQHRLRYG